MKADGLPLAVHAFLTELDCLRPEDTVCCALSGGADSVCLLRCLLALSQEWKITLSAVHINHHLRGAESDRDAAFCRELCEALAVPLQILDVDAAQYARQMHCSEELAARTCRYEAFSQVQADWIATAHTASDNAETLVHRLIRGAGLHGLCAIPPRNGRFLRPLLTVTREQVEQYLAQLHQDFVTDSTNLTDQYTRNRIRHHILSYAEEEIVHGATANMNRAAKQLQEADEYVMRQTLAAVKRCCVFTEHPKAASVKLSLLQKEDPFIQKRLLFYTVCEIAGRKKDITEAHIQSIYKLLQGTGSKECMLPYQVHVYKQYEWVKIEKSEAERGISQEKYMELPELPVDIPSVMDVPGLGKVEFRTFPCEKSQIIPQKTYTKWFDYDKITKIMCLRPRQAGDYLTVNQQMGRKSLQDYFVDQKIPKENRNSLYVLAMDHHVVWVPGLRISEYFKITEQTEHVLQVKVLSKE